MTANIQQVDCVVHASRQQIGDSVLCYMPVQLIASIVLCTIRSLNGIYTMGVQIVPLLVLLAVYMRQLHLLILLNVFNEAFCA